jgi:hypothetical protein
MLPTISLHLLDGETVTLHFSESAEAEFVVRRLLHRDEAVGDGAWVRTTEGAYVALASIVRFRVAGF